MTEDKTQTSQKAPFLKLLFPRRGSGLELVQVGVPGRHLNERLLTRSELGPWRESLRAFCIAMLIARANVRPNVELESSLTLGWTRSARTWIWCLSYAILRSRWSSKILDKTTGVGPFLSVTGGRGASGSIRPDGMLKSEAGACLNTTLLPPSNIQIFEGDSMVDAKEVTDAEELLRMAVEIRDQVPSWTTDEYSAIASIPSGGSACALRRLEHPVLVRVQSAESQRFVPISGPVRSGALLEIHVRVDAPLHLFVVWIDQKGEPHSLYPWRQLNWTQLEDELPRATLKLPEDGTSLKTTGPSGLETLVVLGSERKPDRRVLEGMRRELGRSRMRIPAAKLGLPQLSAFTPNWTDTSLLGVTRGVEWVRPPEALVELHKKMGSQLRKTFDQVFILTFANAGRSPGA